MVCGEVVDGHKFVLGWIIYRLCRGDNFDYSWIATPDMKSFRHIDTYLLHSMYKCISTYHWSRSQKFDDSVLLLPEILDWDLYDTTYYRYHILLVLLYRYTHLTVDRPFGLWSSEVGCQSVIPPGHVVIPNNKKGGKRNAYVWQPLMQSSSPFAQASVHHPPAALLYCTRCLTSMLYGVNISALP